MANSADPDETLCSIASHLGLHCLLRLVYPNTYGKYHSPVIMLWLEYMEFFFYWEFLGQVNTIKVMYSQSVIVKKQFSLVL